MEVVIWCQLTGEGGDIEEQEKQGPSHPPVQWQSASRE